jgi:hypothetical protein
MWVALTVVVLVAVVVAMFGTKLAVYWVLGELYRSERAWWKKRR